MICVSDAEYHYCRQMKIFVVQSELNCCRKYACLCLNVQDVTKVVQEVLQLSPFTHFLRPCWNALMNEVAIHQFELLDLTHIETNTTLLSNIILKLTLPRKRKHVITQCSIWNVIVYVSLIVLHIGSAKWHSCSFDQLQVFAVCLVCFCANDYQCCVFPLPHS